VLGFEMDRLTPFRADDVYFDYRVVSRDAAAGQLVVQLAVARRDLVDARVEKLRAWGVSVQGVSVRDDMKHSAPLDLLPSEQHGERESARERMVQRALLFAVVVLAIVALVLPAWLKRDTVQALLPLVARERQEAESTGAIAGELEKQVADYNFLLARKHGSYPVLALVEEVSRLLPDNTWVQQLDVKTVGKVREVQMAGETSSSSRLIEILEQSTLLQNAMPKGSVTRGSVPNTERFVIAAEVRPRQQPDATPVLEMLPAAAARPAAAAPPKANPAGKPASAPAPSATPAPSAPSD
jgi:general secretion pathway protein L